MDMDMDMHFCSWTVLGNPESQSLRKKNSEIVYSCLTSQTLNSWTCVYTFTSF